MLRDPWPTLRAVPPAALAACTVAAGLWVLTDSPLRWPGIDAAGAEVTAPIGSTVNRTLKGDRLASRTSNEAKRIATIEIVGVRDVTIIYRDAQGQEIFRTNPVSNATVTARNVVLPTVTVRDDSNSAASPIAIDAPTRKDADLPIGCESPFSPYADPTAPHRPARCLSRAGQGPQFASAATLR